MNIILNILIGFFSIISMALPLDKSMMSQTQIVENKQVLASEEFSLKDRYRVESVNNIFADNILLALKYLDGDIQKGESINWDEVRQPDQAVFELKPGESFAFHDNLNQKYDDNVVQTTNAHFVSSEGFKSDGFIVGDGVCHLASFINVLASEAGLDVYAPVRHDFAPIPDVSREFGTSINSGDTVQNLYVTNNTNKTVAFVFDHSFDSVKITVESV